MCYTEKLIDKIKNSREAENIIFLNTQEENVLPFPLGKVCVRVSVEEEQVDFLLGDEDGVYAEQLDLCVMTDEVSGSEQCREQARKICTELIMLDTEKMILSVSAGKCRFNENALAYEIVVCFRLRPVRKNGGE